MSTYNRYYFTKDVYPGYLVILLKKGKPYSFGIDRKILNHIGFKDKTSILQKKKIINVKIKTDKMSKLKVDNFYQFFTILVIHNRDRLSKELYTNA